MGKKGDLLRAQKAARVTYTFTREQLMEHDIAVRRAYREDIMARVQADADELDKKRTDELNAKITRLWDDREKRFKTGYEQGDALAVASALMSVAVAELVEGFGWTPVRNGHKTRLQRFCEGVSERLNHLHEQERVDIVLYAEEVERLYGVSFMMEDAE